MPLLVKLPGNMSLQQAIAVCKLSAPTWQEFDSWYGDGPMNPRVGMLGSAGFQRRTYARICPTSYQKGDMALEPYCRFPHTHNCVGCAHRGGVGTRPSQHAKQTKGNNSRYATERGQVGDDLAKGGNINGTIGSVEIYST